MLRIILIPRGHHQELHPLGMSNFLSMRRKFVSYSQPIRFVRIDSAHAHADGKSVNRGVRVLDLLKDLKGSWCWLNWWRWWRLIEDITWPPGHAGILFSFQSFAKVTPTSSPGVPFVMRLPNESRPLGTRLRSLLKHFSSQEQKFRIFKQLERTIKSQVDF